MLNRCCARGWGCLWVRSGRGEGREREGWAGFGRVVAWEMQGCVVCVSGADGVMGCARWRGRG